MSLISNCADNLFGQYNNISADDFSQIIDMQPGLNGITGHLLGSKVLIKWCHKNQNNQLLDTLEQSTKAFVAHCSNNDNFLNVDCHGSIYTSSMLCLILPTWGLFSARFVERHGQKWINSWKDWTGYTVATPRSPRRYTCMLRAAIVRWIRLNLLTLDNYSRVFKELIDNIDSSTPLHLGWTCGTLLYCRCSSQWLDRSKSHWSSNSGWITTSSWTTSQQECNTKPWSCLRLFRIELDAGAA